MFGSRFANSQPLGRSSSAGGAFGANTGNNNNNIQSGFSGFGNSGGNTTAFGGASGALNSPFGANNAQPNVNSGGLFGMPSNNSNSTAGAPTGAGNGGASLLGMNGNSAGGSIGGVGAMGMNANAGTSIKPFSPVEEKDPTTNVMNIYQSITFMNEYRNSSFEELRFQDYQAGRKFGNGAGPASSGSFTASQPGASTFGMNNQTNNSNAFQSNTFGQKPANAPAFGNNMGINSAGGLFGSNTNTGNSFGANQNSTNNAFGSNPSGGLFGGNATNNTSSGGLFGNKFGANNSNTGNGLFGQPQQQSPFGASNTIGKSAQPSGGLFGQPNTANPFSSSTSQGGGIFGQNNQQQRPGGGLFGQSNQGGAFGQNNQPQGQTSLFGQQNTGNNNSLFGNKPQSGGLFGQSNNTGSFNGSSGGLFGQNNQGQQQNGGLFGQNNQGQQAGGLFGQNNQGQQNTFGQGAQTQPGGLFGQNNQQTQQAGGLFGAKPPTSSGGLFGGGQSTQGGLLGQNQTQSMPTNGLFGQNTQQQTATSGGLFGSKPNGFGSNNTGGGLFGNNAQNTNQQGGGLFGNKTNGTGFGNSNGSIGQGVLGNNNTSTTSSQPGGLFGSSNQSTIQSGGLFGKPTQPNTFGSQPSGGLFGAKPIGQGSTTGSSLFGNNNITNNNGGGGLFGSQNQQQNSNSLLGNAIGANNNNLQLQQQDQQLKSQEQQMLVSNPYGTNDLFSKVQQTAPQTHVNVSIQVSATKIDADNKKKTDLINAYKKTPKPLFSANSTQLSLLKNVQTVPEATSKKENTSNNLNLNIDTTFQQIGSKLFEPDTSLFKAMIKTNSNAKKQKQILEITESDENSVDKPRPITDSIKNTEFSKENAENEKEEQSNIQKQILSKNNQILSDDTRKGKIDPTMEDSCDLSYVDDYYYISPSLETLSKYSPAELGNVQNLTVGHSKFGKVEFLEPVDLNGIPLGSICGDLVIFEPMALILYSNSTEKPSFGKGLNVKARVSCYNCYPLNKSTREPIKDPNHTLMKRHKERLKNAPNTHFESFDPRTGTYCFIIDHALV